MKTNSKLPVAPGCSQAIGAIGGKEQSPPLWSAPEMQSAPKVLQSAPESPEYCRVLWSTSGAHIIPTVAIMNLHCMEKKCMNFNQLSDHIHEKYITSRHL